MPSLSTTGLRAVGVHRTAVMFVLVFTCFAALFVLELRSDYLHPTEIGTDVGTYFAAGQRLDAGHEIYALAPGDRPVPIWPPYWTVPLVGPPTIAVLWAPLAAALPPLISIYGWWLAVLATTAAIYLRTIRRGPGLVVVAAGLLSLSTIITAFSGNVNGLLIGATAAIWFVAQGPRTTRRDILIGILIALTTSLKITPVVFGFWLVALGRWRAIAAAAAAGAVLVLVTVAVAGPEIVPTYFRLAADTAAGGVTSSSVGGILQAAGLPQAIVVAAPVGVILICGLLAMAFRRDARTAFSVVAIGATLAVPIVRFENLSLLLVALIPWARAPQGMQPVRAVE
jgi:hypothetical protein